MNEVVIRLGLQQSLAVSKNSTEQKIIISKCLLIEIRK